MHASPRGDPCHGHSEAQHPGSHAGTRAHRTKTNFLHLCLPTGPPLEEHLQQNTLWPEVRKLYGHGNELYCLAADPRGAYFASACRWAQAPGLQGQQTLGLQAQTTRGPLSGVPGVARPEATFYFLSLRVALTHRVGVAAAQAEQARAVARPSVQGGRGSCPCRPACSGWRSHSCFGMLLPWRQQRVPISGPCFRSSKQSPCLQRFRPSPMEQPRTLNPTQPAGPLLRTTHLLQGAERGHSRHLALGHCKVGGAGPSLGGAQPHCDAARLLPRWPLAGLRLARPQHRGI